MIPPPDYFAHLFDYVKWADLRQLETSKSLSDEEYFKDRSFSFGTIHKVMLHQLAAQSVWLDRFVGQNAIWLYDDSRLAARNAIEPQWNAIHQRFTKFFSDQTPESLAAEVRYKNLRGEDFAFPLWKLLVHVLNHSTHHRGQLNSMIKLAGAKPPVTDYAVYITTLPKT